MEDCLGVCPHVLLGLLVLGAKEQVLVVLLLEILLQGVLRRLGILFQGVTCRWHVRLDLSWVGSVANST
jgi:hypothetical protein